MSFYLGGGNTANLLDVWRAHQLDVTIRDAWSRGSVLCGVSAGMVCWFNGGLPDSYGAQERLNDGLGLIQATACPHYGGNERRAAFHQTIAEGRGTGMVRRFTSLEGHSPRWSAPERKRRHIESSGWKQASSRLDCGFATWGELALRGSAAPTCVIW